MSDQGSQEFSHTILVDARWLRQTGIGRFLSETLPGIIGDNDNILFKLLVREEDYDYANKRYGSYINAKIITTNISWYGFGEQFKLLKVINSTQCDLVYFVNFNFPILLNKKFVVVIHDITLFKYNTFKAKSFLPWAMIKNIIMRLVVFLAAHRSQAIITPTKFVKKRLVDTLKVSASKITVVYQAGTEAVEADDTSKVMSKFNINKPYILHAGVAYPHKNLERLIVAFGKLITKYKRDYQLVLVGKKDIFYKRLEQDIKNANLEDRIILTGYVEDRELSTLYHNALCYCLPSLSEGFGLPVLEAYKYKTPLVCSNATCLPEVAGDGALYFDPTDVNDMASKIAEITLDQDLRKELVEKGSAIADNFSWDKTSSQIANLLIKSI